MGLGWKSREQDPGAITRLRNGADGVAQNDLH